MRLKIAKEKGDHSKQDWSAMKIFFNNTCVMCFGESRLLNVERDHIIPIYQGGSNAINNIQPLCAKCNSSKGPDSRDYRIKYAERFDIKLPDIYKT